MKETKKQKKTGPIKRIVETSRPRSASRVPTDVRVSLFFLPPSQNRATRGTRNCPAMASSFDWKCRKNMSGSGQSFHFILEFVFLFLFCYFVSFAFLDRSCYVVANLIALLFFSSYTDGKGYKQKID